MRARLPLRPLAVAFTLSIAAASGTASAAPPESEADKTLYYLGVIQYKQLDSWFHLSPEELAIVMSGLQEASKGEAPPMDERVYGMALEELRKERAAVAAAAEKTLSAEYVAKAGAADGAVTTDSGLIITEITAGTGASPGPTDTVKVHYHGTLRDGTVFDSSVDRGTPAEFPLNRVIPCWTEAVQLIKVGGKSRIVCPADIAYGERGAPPRIPASAALTFEVELIEVVAQ